MPPESRDLKREAAPCVPEDARTTRPLIITGLYLLFVFGIGLLIAPWVYWGVQEMGRRNSGWQDLAEYPFNRYITRCLMVMAIVGLWPYLRSLRIRTAGDAGLRSDRSLRDFGWGFLAGVLTIFTFAAISLLLGARVSNQHNAPEWIRHFRNALLAAVATGFLEEIVFRGALFRSFRCGFSFASAAFFSSAIYALVHFFARPENLPAIHWYSGFVVLGQMLEGFRDIRTFIPAFPNLLVLGLALALAYERTGAIFFGIGLHASIVFASKTVRFASEVPLEASQWFWGSNKVIDGWFAFIVIFGLYLALGLWLKKVKGHEHQRAARKLEDPRG